MPFDKIPVARKQDIIVQELKGEVLVYDLKIDKAFCLNETSALVWQLCDGESSVAEISRTVGKKLNSPANEDLVWLALDQLKKENLLANSEEVVANFDGMSRREVIKKVGLATMIALPIISSLVAPTAAQAQSGLAAACGTNVCRCEFNDNALGSMNQTCQGNGSPTDGTGCPKVSGTPPGQCECFISGTLRDGVGGNCTEPVGGKTTCTGACRVK